MLAAMVSDLKSQVLDNVDNIILLAPIMSLENIGEPAKLGLDSLFFKALRDVGEDYIDFLGEHGHGILDKFCSLIAETCEEAISLVSGDTKGSFPEDIMGNLTGHYPVITSTKDFIHLT